MKTINPLDYRTQFKEVFEWVFPDMNRLSESILLREELGYSYDTIAEHVYNYLKTLGW